MNALIVVLDGKGFSAVGEAEVLVVAPALNSRLRHWLQAEEAIPHAA